MRSAPRLAAAFWVLSAAHSLAAPLAPVAVAARADAKRVFVACAEGRKILVVDVDAQRVVAAYPVPLPVSGLALSAAGQRLYATCAGPSSRVLILDAATGKLIGTLRAGHTAMSPVLSPDEKRLYILNRFENSVAIFDVASGKEIARALVRREPVAAAVTPDGRLLLVANHLPHGPSDGATVAAVVSLIDALDGKALDEIVLPSGSTALRDIRLSPDGRLAAVTHLLARFNLPTTQVDRGWMNTNAVSLVDVPARRLLNTVLLDEVDRGAANSWAAAWSGDGRHLAVTHAGTHELSVIEVPALLAKLARMPPPSATGQGSYPTQGSGPATDVANDLAFLVGLRRRVETGGNGPRALAVAAGKAFVGGYFSDTLSVVDLATASRTAIIPLGPEPRPDEVRRGEILFNDATYCFQHWQSCASCHPDIRSDALHWDLLNDGIGNPKNTKSLLFSHHTPPAMSSGVRESAETAVRAGIRHILFAEPREEHARAIDAFLRALRPVPSPYLRDGQLSAAAARGKRYFFDPRVACGSCHKGPHYTDLRSYDVGTRGALDTHDSFDTPTLIENWRTAPYLHDGRAATMMEVLTTHNPGDRHGKTSHLTRRQLADLAEFVLSL